jgi:DNA replication protein DnaC
VKAVRSYPLPYNAVVDQSVPYAVRSREDSIPKRYQWATFDAPELSQRVRDLSAIPLVRAWAASDSDRLFLIGVAGVGKTVLATCALRARADLRDTTGLFVDAFTLAKARTASELGREPAAISWAVESHVVVLDDLGAEPKFASSAVPEVLHQRHAGQGITIVTSGFSIADLDARYGSGIVRRLTEHATVIQLRPPLKVAR